MRNVYAVSLLILLSGSCFAQEADPQPEPEIPSHPLTLSDVGGFVPEDKDGKAGVWLSMEAVDRVNAWKLELHTRRRLEELDKKDAALDEKLRKIEKKEADLELKRCELQTESERIDKEDAENETKEAKRKEKLHRWKGWVLEGIVIAATLL